MHTIDIMTLNLITPEDKNEAQEELREIEQAERQAQKELEREQKKDLYYLINKEN